MLVAFALAALLAAAPPAPEPVAPVAPFETEAAAAGPASVAEAILPPPVRALLAEGAGRLHLQDATEEVRHEDPLSPGGGPPPATEPAQVPLSEEEQVPGGGASSPALPAREPVAVGGDTLAPQEGPIPVGAAQAVEPASAPALPVPGRLPALDLAGPWLLPGTALTLLVGLLGSDGWLPRLRRLWAAVAGALRVRDAAPGDARSQRLYETVLERPGLSTRELARLSGLGLRRAAAALSVLERAGLLEREVRGASSHHFAARARLAPAQKEACILLRHRTHGSLLAFIHDNPGLGQRALARAVGLHPSQANASLRLLAQAGLVGVRREGSAFLYYPGGTGSGRSPGHKDLPASG